MKQAKSSGSYDVHLCAFLKSIRLSMLSFHETGMATTDLFISDMFYSYI